MLKKVAIISGIVFSSILLVGCNGEPEVAVIELRKTGEMIQIYQNQIYYLNYKIK